MTEIQVPINDTLRDSCVLGANYAVGKQTFIIPLTFTNITAASDIITRVGYGGDIWEMRVDLLAQEAPLGETNLPSPTYVEQQIKGLQSMSDMPILFTIRTKSQGGKFPDGAADEALVLMLLAVSYGIQYVDVEIEWPDSLFKSITEKKGASKIVGSFHDWTGNIRWTSQTLQERLKKADGFGGKWRRRVTSNHSQTDFSRYYQAQHPFSHDR
jgi:3-dehydroquinate dehydratase type I